MIPSVFSYLDYRQYITDVFQEKKRLVPSFSYRNFAKMAGSTSPNLYQLVTTRRLNLSTRQKTALAHSLSLTADETEYLTVIVKFDHAKTHREKDKYFQHILLMRDCRSIDTIEKHQYEYLSHWYNPVIRELITSFEYPDDPQWIADRIIPAVSIKKVKKSIELLQKLGIIKRTAGDRSWVCTHKTIATPAHVISMAAVTYHQDMISLGRESLERFTVSDRDVRSVTVGCSREGYTILKKRMQAFWKEMLAFADTQERTEQVAQMNLQLFPVSLYKKERG